MKNKQENCYTDVYLLHSKLRTNAGLYISLS